MKASKPEKQKTVRHFASRLINVAARDHRWNTHALVDLFRLVYEELNLDTKSGLKCLKQLQEIASPKMIASLIKRKIVEFSIREILDVLIEQAKTLDDLCRLIEECIHHEILDLNSKDTLFELRTIITKVNMNETDIKYYQAFLCDQCPTKATVGRLLYFFIGPPIQDSTSSLSMLYDNVKLTTIYEIMTSQTFRTLSGSLHSFYSQLKHCETQLHNLLSQNNMLDRTGNFIDFDSDDNLRDFISLSDDDESSQADEDNSAQSISSTDSEVTASTTGPQAPKKILESTRKEPKISTQKTAYKKLHQSNPRKRRHTVESDEENDEDDNDYVIRNGQKYSKKTINCFDDEAEESSSDDETI